MKISPSTAIIAAIFGTILLVSACKKDTDTTAEITKDATPYTLEFSDFPPPPLAADNALTEQGVKLGRMLFYEKKLSKDGSMSCASCHRQQHAFSDTNKLSTGVDGFFGKRQAMAIFNTAWHTNEFFWDGRSHLLRDQSLKPIEDSLEMAAKLENVVTRLTGEQLYRNQFKRVFGSEEITSEKMSLAMEQFMNSIVSVNSKYDKFLRGDVTLTASEERGRELFFGEYNQFFPNTSGADCAHCHSSSNFSNNEYMNNGLEDNPGLMKDIGRESVTQNPNDRGKMKVPSLRNIALTPPYMHDGRFTTLEEVVEHYNTGITISATLDPALLNTTTTGLMLDAQDKMDLVAFLKTLTDDDLMTNPDYSDPF